MRVENNGLLFDIDDPADPWVVVQLAHHIVPHLRAAAALSFLICRS
jgi:hypothetical protein